VRAGSVPSAAWHLSRPLSTDIRRFLLRNIEGADIAAGYSRGGFFEPHRDKHALTVNVLLGSAGDAFDGGGTAFWMEEQGAREEDGGGGGIGGKQRAAESQRPTLSLHPLAGVGVIFSGTVKHAGMAVTRGVRHVLVASFSITDDACAPSSRHPGTRAEGQ
jgi:hypothetical protein